MTILAGQRSVLCTASVAKGTKNNLHGYLGRLKLTGLFADCGKVKGLEAQELHNVGRD